MPAGSRVERYGSCRTATSTRWTQPSPDGRNRVRWWCASPSTRCSATPLHCPTWPCLCDRHDATLLVDEAHGLGVAGAGGLGLVADAALTGPRVVVTLTLSKSLGSQGGAVLGSRSVVDHLVNTARPFIFDTGLAPAAAGAALAALDLLVDEPGLAGRVRDRSAEIAAGCGVAATSGAIVPVPMPGPEQAVTAQQAARAAGVLVGCFRPPSVPDGISRLRLTAHATLTDADVAKALAVLAEVLR